MDKVEAGNPLAGIFADDAEWSTEQRKEAIVVVEGQDTLRVLDENFKTVATKMLRWHLRDKTKCNSISSLKPKAHVSGVCVGTMLTALGTIETIFVSMVPNIIIILNGDTLEEVTKIRDARLQSPQCLVFTKGRLYVCLGDSGSIISLGFSDSSQIWTFGPKVTFHDQIGSKTPLMPWGVAVFDDDKLLVSVDEGTALENFYNNGQKTGVIVEVSTSDMSMNV